MKNLELAKSLLNHMRFLIQRQRTRRQLLNLENAALIDVGISREEALEEGSKPFWKQGVNSQVTICEDSVQAKLKKLQADQEPALKWSPQLNRSKVA